MYKAKELRDDFHLEIKYQYRISLPIYFFLAIYSGEFIINDSLVLIKRHKVTHNRPQALVCFLLFFPFLCSKEDFKIVLHINCDVYQK